MPHSVPLLPRPPPDRPVSALGEAVDLAPGPGPTAAGAILAESYAPTTVRRRLSAIGKMHRFNDLPWNAGHRDIQGVDRRPCETSTKNIRLTACRANRRPDPPPIHTGQPGHLRRRL